LFAELLVDARKSANAYGNGSLGAYGQPILSTLHPYLD
jgi:hypothetical protein